MVQMVILILFSIFLAPLNLQQSHTTYNNQYSYTLSVSDYPVSWLHASIVKVIELSQDILPTLHVLVVIQIVSSANQLAKLCSRCAQFYISKQMDTFKTITLISPNGPQYSIRYTPTDRFYTQRYSMSLQRLLCICLKCLIRFHTLQLNAADQSSSTPSEFGTQANVNHETYL